MEPLDPTASPVPAPEPKSGIRPTKLATGLVAGGAAFGMVLAGLGIAAAQTDGGATTTAPPAASTPAAPADGAATGGRHHRPRAVIGAGLDVAAKTLGITPAELRTQLQSGKSIADVAGGNTDAVIAAMVKAGEDHLAKDVAAGRLTQAQADERKATLTERVTAFVNKVPPAPGAADSDGDTDGGGRPGRDGLRPSLAAVASILAIDEADLRTQLQSGKSLAQIAGDKTGAVVDALVQQAQARLDQAVADGKLTQAQADERKANLTQRITDMVNRTPPAGGPGHQNKGGAPDGDGPDGDGRGGHGPDGDGTPPADGGTPPASGAQPQSQPASVTA